MDVLEAIRSRRTVKKIRSELPRRDLIEEILEAATWAPNHRLNEPWRFFVLAGEARVAFGEQMAEDACATMEDSHGEQALAMAEAQRRKAVRSPVIIAVSCEPATDPKIVDVENLCAVACAIQNLMLAAEAHGLATKWSTGYAAVSVRIKRFFGLSPDHQILGFIYLGYPDGESGAPSRSHFSTKTTWLGWPG